MDAFQIDVSGVVAVDVGAAAGGFTAALLHREAARVYAVDVGFGQLVGSLRADARVINLERTNLASLDSDLVPDVVDVVTIDLSYLPVAGQVGGSLGSGERLRLRGGELGNGADRSVVHADAPYARAVTVPEEPAPNGEL